ncbi:hypothetical protein ABEY65_17505 [Priestia aryabhattai]|uniref:hypothetical protein n=1 Tax=Priestia aryabhattai TaxID=412384 RepID=UPI003D2ACF0A
MIKKAFLQNKVNVSILINFATKGGGFLVSFIVLALLSNQMSNREYGLWLTLYSMITWFTLIDGGVGNGMRNILAEKLALGEVLYSKKVISSAYYYMLKISSIVLLIGIFLIIFTRKYDIILFHFSFEEIIVFFLSMVLLITFQLINFISLANQDAYLPGLGVFFSNLLFLIIISLTSSIEKNLLVVIFIYSFSVNFVTLLFSLILFSRKYKHIKPSFKLKEFKYFKMTFGVGINFLILQLGFVLVYTTDTFLALQFINPDAATKYQLNYRIFSVVTIIGNIVVLPFWSRFTQLFVQKKYNEIYTSIRKLILVIMALGVIGIVLFFLRNFILDIWIGKIYGSTKLAFLILVFVVQMAWTNVFANFMNGIYKVRVQMFTLIIGVLIKALFLMILYYLDRVTIENIVLSSIIGLTTSMIVLPYYSFNLIKKNKEMQREVEVISPV